MILRCVLPRGEGRTTFGELDAPESRITAELLDDQIGLAVAQTLDGDHGNSFGLQQQIAIGAGRAQAARLKGAHDTGDQAIVLFHGQQGQALSGTDFFQERAGFGHTITSQQAIGMGLGQGFDGIQRMAGNSLAVDIAQDVHATAIDGQRSHAPGKDSDLAAAPGSGKGRHKAGHAGADNQDVAISLVHCRLHPD